MKKLLFFLCLIAFSLQTNLANSGYNSSESKGNFYPTINLLVGNPIQEFWENYSKQRLWGFDIGLHFPIKNADWFQPGLLVEAYPFSGKKGNWKGIDVKTSGAFVKGSLITRFRFLNESRISPFVEFGYGFNLSSTSTTYEVVDEATFLEEFLFDEEDVTEKVTVKDFTHTSHNFNAGAGIIFNQVVSFHVKYNLTSIMRYVEKDDVKVTQNNVTYRISESPMQMIVLSVGFSLEKLFNE